MCNQIIAKINIVTIEGDCTLGTSNLYCEDPCDGEYCNNHGECVSTSLTNYSCVCDSGYISNGLSCINCDSINCSGHGTCGYSNNTPICSCDAGYHNGTNISCIAN